MGLSLLLSLVGFGFLGEANSITADAPPRVPVTKPSEQLGLKSKTIESMSQDGADEKKGARKKAPSKVRRPSGKTSRVESRPSRLPRFYSQLNLEDNQQQKVREVQQGFGRQITALREEITKLQKERDSQLEAVLRPTQKRRLRELQAESATTKK